MTAGGEAQTVPPTELCAATGRALDDLRRASGIKPGLAFAQAPDAADAWRITARFPDGSEIGFEILIGDACHLLVSVADGLQQAVIEYLARAVPRCPAHEHPLTPVCASGRAVWSCPASGESYGEIGRLDLEPGPAESD